MRGFGLLTAAAAIAVTPLGVMGAALPTAIDAPGEVVVLQVHAVGAQIYECKAGAGGRTLWQFREPIAALFRDGKTVGRHYAGPTWEVEGGTVVGKTIGKAPGAGGTDIPWLKLQVIDHRGIGPLRGATTIQRINTQGGNLDGACDKPGALRAEPYAADYLFLKKP